ncbi:PspC domain-containing protein, partial [Clostridioides difficile]
IAEQLLDRKNKDAVVTIEDVNSLIKVMGRVEDIAGETPDNKTQQSNTQSSTSSSFSHRKLYRNTDDVWLMGVASGMAAYLDIDPLIV